MFLHCWPDQEPVLFSMAAAEAVDQVEGLFARLETAVKNGQAKRGLKAADESEWPAGWGAPGGLCLRQHDFWAGQDACYCGGRRMALTWFAAAFAPLPPPPALLQSSSSRPATRMRCAARRCCS